MTVEIVHQPPPALTDGAAQSRNATNPVGLASILVTCCGQQELTRLCVASLLRHCRGPYELHFLDGGSLDGTTDFLAGVAVAAPVKVSVSRVTALPGPTGQRKEESVQLRGEFVVLLNNDTMVTDGWLEALKAAANRDATIGMVAPMSNYAPPPLLVERVPYGIGTGIGGAGPNNSTGEDLQAGIAALDRFALQWRESNSGKYLDAERLGGGCVLLKRRALQAIGMFPTRTALGSFDTVGLSERIRQAGFRLSVCVEAFIHHFGSRNMANA